MLQELGYIPPNLHTLDNECSDSVRQIIQKNNEIQLVGPHNKRVNAAERTICTFNKISNCRTIQDQQTLPIITLGRPH